MKSERREVKVRGVDRERLVELEVGDSIGIKFKIYGKGKLNFIDIYDVFLFGLVVGYSWNKKSKKVDCKIN